MAMPSRPTSVQRPSDARTRLLQAAVRIVREKGYCATSVDDLCAEAGVTKGAFFHHFRNKEDLGVAASDYWSETTSELFAAAPYHDLADPLDRVLGYLDFRRDLIAGAAAQFTCLVGTLVQEVFVSHPAIREACFESISSHAARLEADLADAIAALPAPPPISARGLALHTQAVLQGSFILAKAADDPTLAIAGVDHLARYIRLLFNRPAP